MSKFVLLVRDGQMCNQLLSLAALYSLGLEKKCDIEVPVFDENLKNFLFSNDNNYISVNLYSSHFYNKLNLLINYIKRFTKKDFRKDYHFTWKNDVHYFMNWLSFMDGSAFINHLDEIRVFLKLTL